MLSMIDWQIQQQSFHTLFLKFALPKSIHPVPHDLRNAGLSILNNGRFRLAQLRSRKPKMNKLRLRFSLRSFGGNTSVVQTTITLTTNTR